MAAANLSLRERYHQVCDRIERAAICAGRKPGEITLVAVTKLFPAAAIREAHNLGLRDFGENYVQEFQRKQPEAAGLAGARFHLIGHLQSNKASIAAELFHVIETVDSAKLARRLDAASRRLEVMLEVKLSAEDSKSGADPESLPELIESVRACPNLQLTGLMTIPPWSDDPEQTRPYFIRLRKLAEQFQLSGLSMGMSGDFETAIEEGATLVRIGTALFGERRPRQDPP